MTIPLLYVPTSMKVGFFSIISALVISASSLSAQSVSEYEVKVAMIFNFVRFTEFPHVAEDTPLRICILPGYPGSSEALKLEGRLIGKSFIQVVNVAQPSIAKDRGCYVLVFPSNDSPSEDLSHLATLGILTIGEDERFLDRGGVIQFLTENNKIRFSVSLEAASKGGIVVSSKVLALGKSYQGNQ